MAIGGGGRPNPDHDAIDALTGDRDALWTRLQATSFLTDDEKRAAIGYGPKPREASLALAQKAGFKPDQPRDDHGKWVDDGGGDGSEDPQPAARRPSGGKPPPGKPADPPAKPPPQPPTNLHGKTLGGREYTKHGKDQANDRGFTDQNIDAIVDNNAKNRVGKVDANGRKTWEYRDSRGNTVVTNEDGGVVTVFSPIQGGFYIP